MTTPIRALLPIAAARGRLGCYGSRLGHHYHHHAPGASRFPVRGHRWRASPSPSSVARAAQARRWFSDAHFSDLHLKSDRELKQRVYDAYDLFGCPRGAELDVFGKHHRPKQMEIHLARQKAVEGNNQQEIQRLDDLSKQVSMFFFLLANILSVPSLSHPLTHSPTHSPLLSLSACMLRTFMILLFSFRRTVRRNHGQIKERKEK